jgi:hypothetical protein
MARTTASKAYNTFVNGFISEASPLSFPENATYDELNNELDNTGRRSVRLGVDFENGYALSSFTKSNAVNSDGAHVQFEWQDVDNNGDVNFLVCQIGSTLHFYNNAAEAISSNLKSFTVDLSIFAINPTVGNNRCQFDSGNGWLFVVAEDIKPFYVKYNQATDNITATEIGIRIRDTEGLDDGLDPDEEPVSLSDEHNYNLKNQGWNPPATGGTDPITSYFSSQSEYPPNSKQWWIAKNSEDNFDPAELAKIYLGNTLAPRGHFILDPFNKDRTTTSGVSNLSTETSSTRPTCVAFYAGRAWYWHNGNLYYSQILEGEVNVGRCYQSADPTAEEINEIVDTDGGVIPIPEAGTGKRLFVTGDSLLVMCSNGVWEVSGSIGAGFRPTDYNVNKVGTAALLSPESVVDVEGIPVWWSDIGIYTVARSNTTDRLVTQSLSEDTIQTWYENTVPSLSKEYATGRYDPTTKIIQWLWRSDGTTDAFKYNYDRVLNFNVRLGAFYPWQVDPLTSDSPYICGLFITEALIFPSESVGVLDSNLDIVITSGSDTVVATQNVATSSQSQIKFLCVVPAVSGVKYTVAETNNTGYVDWFTQDNTGVAVNAYMETGFILEGDIANWKQQPYVYFFFEEDGDNTSCFVQYKWDWASSGNSGKWGTKRQVYSSRLNHYTAYTRQKIRGKGKALQIRFENETGKGYTLLGWSGRYETTTQP